MMIKCVKQYQSKSVTFKEGETYNGNTINENWWMIDAVGIPTEKFNECFKIIESNKVGVAEMV